MELPEREGRDLPEIGTGVSRTGGSFTTSDPECPTCTMIVGT